MDCRKVVGTLLKLLPILATLFGTAALGRSQTDECRDEWPDHLVRSITVKARWLPKFSLPLKPGDPFTPDKLRETRLAVIREVGKERSKFNSEFVNLGKLPLVDVNFVRACGRKVATAVCQSEGLGTNCVDVEVRPYGLSTDPIFMTAVLLPMPRSNEFTFLGNVPRPLRLFNPKFGLERDVELGTSPTMEISTDLLSVGEVAKGDPAETRRAALLLKANGSKSIGEPFYRSRAELSLLGRQLTEQIESLSVDASFEAEQQPQKGAIYSRNSLRVAGQLNLNPAFGLLNRLSLRGGYRRSYNRLAGVPSQPTTVTTENSYELCALLDGRLFNGVARLGLWLDGNTPRTSNSYRRFAGLFGYSKEIPVGEHTIGIEVLFGAGWASADTPNYALFYGGNALRDFLYKDDDDPTQGSFPSGPILRSFGRNQAGFPVVAGSQQGANTFQHFNLTISVPIPRLSRSLIPNEVVNLSPRLTLRDLVDFAVNSGQDALSLNLQDQGLSEGEADRKAEKIFGEIRPGIKYLTNYAKLYAIKPLLMFDEARLTRVGFAGSQTRYAAGGGLQLTVVLAKFEAGYIRTLNPVRDDAKGNFVMRLVFQNLF